MKVYHPGKDILNHNSQFPCLIYLLSYTNKCPISYSRLNPFGTWVCNVWIQKSSFLSNHFFIFPPFLYISTCSIIWYFNGAILCPFWWKWWGISKKLGPTHIVVLCLLFRSLICWDVSPPHTRDPKGTLSNK